MTRARVTVWSGKGATAAYDAPATRVLLDAARPPVITLHADPGSLASDAGAKLTERVRRDNPESVIWWAVQGDSHGPDPSAVWSRCTRAAAALGVPVVELNCESGWRRERRAFGVARRAVMAAHEAAPGVTLGHTAFDGPVNFVHATTLGVKRRWGYGQSYDWQGFLGEGSPIAWSAPQVYAAPMLGIASRAMLLKRHDLHSRSWAIAERMKLVRPGLRHIYLQSHHSDTSGLVALAETAPVAAFWCAPGRLDDAGSRAIRAVCELERRGMTVREFQDEAGLAADGVCGPLTLRALGVT